MEKHLSQEEIQMLLNSEGDAQDSGESPEAAVSPLEADGKGVQTQEKEACENPLIETLAPSHDDSEERSSSVHPVVFEELTKVPSSQAPISSMDMLLDIPLSVSVELGKTKCYVKDLLNLTSGSILELDRLAGDPVDILVNGKPFAKGEVVVIDENFGVRIREILATKKKR